MRRNRMDCRLPGRRYKAVFDNARAKRGRFCVAYEAPPGSGGNSPPATGVIATKKTFRRAVDRNRAKRLMREAFRLEAPRLGEGFECILVARAWMRGKKMQDVRADIARLFNGGKSADRQEQR